MYEEYKLLSGKKMILYVGDACGRVNDHSYSDLYFVHNINSKIDNDIKSKTNIDIESKCKFMTYEQYFKSEKNEIINDDPYDYIKKTYIHNKDSIHQYLTEINDIKKTGSVIIFTIGFPASTKSSFTKTYFGDFDYISQDELKTKIKVKSKLKDSIKKGSNIILDKLFKNTEDRGEYLINIPDNYIKICLFFNVPMFICRHLNYNRYIQSQSQNELVPDIVYRTFNKNFEKPTDDEFDYIYEIKPEITINNRLIDSIQKDEMLEIKTGKHPIRTL
jgi:hypothetical protein